MQLTQFLGEAGIYGEAIKIQILPSMWTSQGKKILGQPNVCLVC